MGVADGVDVLIVDSTPLFRSGLRRAIEGDESLNVIGEAASSEEAVRGGRADPDVVVLEVDLRTREGAMEARRIRERWPRTRLLATSMTATPGQVRRAFEAGAAGLLAKTADGDEFIRAIRAIGEGRPYLDPTAGAALAESTRRGPVDQLSLRERETLRLLALGYTNHEIAESLVVSVRTVESHRARVMTKLRATSRAEVVRHALAAGLLDDAS
jgi:two-component system response regulator NreC